MCLVLIREGVKKQNKLWTSLHVGVEINSQSRLQPKYVFFSKEKKMQNVLKGKNMYFDEKLCEIC